MIEQKLHIQRGGSSYHQPTVEKIKMVGAVRFELTTF
jgi:hypothetical protein